MAFYRSQLTFDKLAPHIEQFRQFLRTNGELVKEAGDDTQEVYFMDRSTSQAIYNEYTRQYCALAAAGFIKVAPFDDQHIMIYFTETSIPPEPTVTISHVRLPKLSHLITLTPEDFFTVLLLISTAKNTPAKDSLSLNPPAAGITNLYTSSLSHFFSQLRINHRINPEYADRKWTPRNAIARIATLEQTQLNQLYAMQYLTALQNPDLLYFPLETMVELEIEWQQMNDDYCIPQTNHLDQ